MAIFCLPSGLDAVLRQSFTLTRVGHADTPDVGAQIGDVGVGGGRRDHGQAGGLVLGAGGDGGAAELVAVDDDDVGVIDVLLGHQHGLFRVGEVIADGDRHVAAVDAAGGVELVHGDLGAGLVRRAVGGVLAGHGTGHAHLEGRRRAAGRGTVVAAAATGDCDQRERQRQHGDGDEHQLAAGLDQLASPRGSQLTLGILPQAGHSACRPARLSGESRCAGTAPSRRAREARSRGRVTVRVRRCVEVGAGRSPSPVRPRRRLSSGPATSRRSPATVSVRRCVRRSRRWTPSRGRSLCGRAWTSSRRRPKPW